MFENTVEWVAILSVDIMFFHFADENSMGKLSHLCVTSSNSASCSSESLLSASYDSIPSVASELDKSHHFSSPEYPQHKLEDSSALNFPFNNSSHAATLLYGPNQEKAHVAPSNICEPHSPPQPPSGPHSHQNDSLRNTCPTSSGQGLSDNCGARPSIRLSDNSSIPKTEEDHLNDTGSPTVLRVPSFTSANRHSAPEEGITDKEGIAVNVLSSLAQFSADNFVNQPHQRTFCLSSPTSSHLDPSNSPVVNSTATAAASSVVTSPNKYTETSSSSVTTSIVARPVTSLNMSITSNTIRQNSSVPLLDIPNSDNNKYVNINNNNNSISKDISCDVSTTQSSSKGGNPPSTLPSKPSTPHMPFKKRHSRAHTSPPPPNPINNNDPIASNFNNNSNNSITITNNFNNKNTFPGVTTSTTATSATTSTNSASDRLHWKKPRAVAQQASLTL